MSVLRHPSFFHRRVSADGRTELFRDFGTFEKILIIARPQIIQQSQPILEKNFFDIHTACDEHAATQEIMENYFDVVICDTGLSQFSLPSFYAAVEQHRPDLLESFIFLVEENTSPEAIEFIERVDGLKVWRPLELSELFQMIEIVLGRNAAMSAQ